MPYIKTLQIVFDFEIAPYEVPAFRGAVIEHVGREFVAFHNHHGEEGFIYKYPEIQYKRIGKKAAIVCLNSGIDDLYQLFSKRDGEIKFSGKAFQLGTQEIKVGKPLVQLWDSAFKYSLSTWLPLNQATFKEFQALEGLTEKISYLEKKLTGNLLSFAKGIQWRVEAPIELKITNLLSEKLITYKNVKLTSFDIEFKTNVSLPNFVGIGKGASTGFGVIRQITEKKNAK